MPFSRRDFLIGCGQTAALSLAPGGARPEDAEATFHLQPNYRERTPLEPVLGKRTAGSDAFPLEKDHEQIAAILANWSAGLRDEQQRMRAIEKILAADFRGCSLQASRAEPIRQSPLFEVRELNFERELIHGRESFVKDLHTYFSDLPNLLTSEFQVTSIAVSPEQDLLTDISYELVGSGPGFYREQRIGLWHLRWQKAVSGEYCLREWRQDEETRSRSKSPVYNDRTIPAFGHNQSYSRQLIHGVDYWRTVLDGASRIDIYGHNGVSVGDIDGNGFDDVYVCQPAGLPNRLYRNRGDGTFEDITEAAGVGVLENTACALFADLNNNGHQDLLVVRANGPLLFVNDGTGKFLAKPEAFRFAGERQGTFTGASAADYDRDGWLDIYFCLYVYYQGTDQYKYPAPYYDANNGPPNILMRNNRDGTFREATAESGLNQNNTRYSFCCGWTDIDNNGWPDLYVANDFGRKNLYRNNGNGTFTDIAGPSGTEDVGAGMSVCAFDYDNDGRQDLYIADMWTAAGERITNEEAFRKNSAASTRALFRKHAMGNSLFRNKGATLFEDRTAAAKVGMGRWSWSSDAWDFDHDGFLDLYITNGMISGTIREDLNGFFWRQVAANSPDEAKPSHSYEQGWNAINELIRADYSWSGFERNVFYANNGDGSFSDVSGVIGLDFLEDSRSFALADLDHDGRLEVILKNRNGPQLRLLKNEMSELPPSISFRLRGTRSNRDAIGAAVTVETDQGKQTRLLQAGSGFLSQHSKELFFGLGRASGPIRASVRWPSGLVQLLHGLPPNHRIHVEEGGSSFRAEPFLPFSAAVAPPQQQERETLPEAIEIWLLSPVTAPDFSLPDQIGRQHTLSKLRGKPVLLYLSASESVSCREGLIALDRVYRSWAAQGLHLLVIDFTGLEKARSQPFSFPLLSASEDTAAVYNILYRALFDRHRDLALPACLLLDKSGDIAKVYSGLLNLAHVERDFRSIPASIADRIAAALPFPGNAATFEFGRNHLSLGSVYFERGYLEQAETWFQVALRDDPSSAEAQYGLGSVYLKQDKTELAAASFEQAVKLDASYSNTKPDAWNNLGLIAIRAGRTDAAIGYFEDAVRLSPDHVISLENLGNAYRQANRWDDARRTLEHAIDVAPEDPQVNYSLGMVFAQTNQPGRAFDFLQKALELRPDYPEAMNNLGVLYLRTRRRDEAIAEFEKCIQTAPGFDQSYLNLARVYLIEGDREKARVTLLSLLNRHPDHAEAQRALRAIK